MVDVVRRRGRRKTAGRGGLGSRGEAALRYAALGWPVCAGAHSRPRKSGRACSCDRVGCPAPGAHPVSPAWQMQATVDTGIISEWWEARPEASVILVTGRVFDVLDVPAAVGRPALAAMDRARVPPGPVAEAAGRALFFVATRGAPANEDEWWSCRLDCQPETVPSQGSLRWHCRDSYVPAPPPVPGGPPSRWVREPGAHPLPDSLRLLEVLVDACDAAGLS